jgi:peptidoglycan/xylan/chitin deacetylase (PgdA/CDA1 family)
MSDFVALNFHGLGAPERVLEPGEAPYWLGAGQFEGILDRIAAHPERARIRITFDDGNCSDATIALPLLLARGLKAEFFVLSGRIGQAGSLDESDIAALGDAGMDLGSHGIAHVDWTGLSPDALEAELAGSKARIEDICGTRVRAAGIPFGLYNSAVLMALRAAGYETAWSSDGGTMRESDFPRARTSLRGAMTPGEIDAILAGRMAPVRRLRRALGMARKRWLA